MFRWFKAEPSEFVIHQSRGKTKRAGAGLSFFYFTPTASISLVPATTLDSAFVFNEVTRNHQQITVQGQLTYRIKDPRKVAELLDFTVKAPVHAYRTKDPEKLAARILGAVQKHTQAAVRELSLEQAVLKGEALAREVLVMSSDDAELVASGLEVLSVHFTSVRPTPEIAKALEADQREALQKRADEAIYARRAAAVEQELKIKENELATQVALEEQKKALIALQAENAEKEALFRAKAMEIELAPYKNTDPKTLMALAFKNIGQNAQKIGNLTLTPDLLAAFMKS
ncbi:MAG: SPFH domain-containing protein [Planctomycetota bacterium]